MYKLFASGIFHLTVSDQGRLLVTEMMKQGAFDSGDTLGLCEDGPKRILFGPEGQFRTVQCGKCLEVHIWFYLGSESPG